MRILLVYPKWTGEYGIFGYFAKRSSAQPPINLAILASLAENLGHEVKIIDGEVENLSIEEVLSQTAIFGPDIIGMGAHTPFFHVTTNYAKAFKKNLSKIPIVLGGPHITILKESAFNKFFDYAFIGEADVTWPLFLKQYEKGEEISGIKGLMYRNRGRILFTGNAETVIDIDALPIPARHLLKQDRYEIGTSQGIKKFTTIMSTRGCPFKCIFCNTSVLGSSIRKRKPRFVVDEIISVVSTFNIKHFVFLDETLTLNKEHILEMCDMIMHEKLDITWEGNTRANLIDEEIVSSMAKAGLIRISFGFESADANIRKIMKKGVPLKAYEKANKLTNKYNIETSNSCMIGMPGETIDTIRSTLYYLRNSREIKQANLSIAIPYPGTQLYDMAKKGENGLVLLSEDFSEYRRYGSAVMQVGDLTPKDLIRLQTLGMVSIFLAPWRIIPVYKKSGIIGLLLMMLRLIKCSKEIILNKDGCIRFKKYKNKINVQLD